MAIGGLPVHPAVSFEVLMPQLADPALDRARFLQEIRADPSFDAPVVSGGICQRRSKSRPLGGRKARRRDDRPADLVGVAWPGRHGSLRLRHSMNSMTHSCANKD